MTWRRSGGSFGKTEEHLGRGANGSSTVNLPKVVYNNRDSTKKGTVRCGFNQAVV